MECPELFRRGKPGCRNLYRADSCCAYDQECGEPQTIGVIYKGQPLLLLSLLFIYLFLFFYYTLKGYWLRDKKIRKQIPLVTCAKYQFLIHLGKFLAVFRFYTTVIFFQ